MRLVIVVLVLLTLYLQYGLWYTRGGKQDVEKLKVSVAEQKDEIARLKERNRSLSAEVMDLKQGLEAIEERARSEMGMIKNGEVFFRITDPKHEHDHPANGVGGFSKGAEPPLEPPLDPLAPGDAVVSEPTEAAAVVQDKPVAVKPMVKAIVKAAAAAKADAIAKPAAGVASKAEGANTKPAASNTNKTVAKGATTTPGKSATSASAAASGAAKATATKPATSKPTAPKPVLKPVATKPAVPVVAKPKPAAPAATSSKPVTSTTSHPVAKTAPATPSPVRKPAPVE